MTNRSVSCPGCQTVLSVPSNIKAFNCPKCKKELALPDSPPVATKPAEVKPKPAEVKPKPTVAPKVKVKASVVNEEKEANEQAEKAKKADIKRQLAEIREEEEEYREKYSEFKVYTKRIRTSLTNAYWGIRFYVLTIMISIPVLVAMNYYPTMARTAIAVLAACSATSMILIALAFGYAIAGPRQTRMYGYIGLPISIAHMGIVFIEALVGFKYATQLAQVETEGEVDIVGISLGRYCSYGLGTNFIPMIDLGSIMFLGWSIPWIPVLGAMLEFTRMAVMVLLIQLYADLAKAPEVGFRAFRAMNVFFWTVLITSTLRMCLSIAFVFIYTGNPRGVPGSVDWFFIKAYFYTFIIAFLRYCLTLRNLTEDIDNVRVFCTADRYIAKSVPDA